MLFGSHLLARPFYNGVDSSMTTFYPSIFFFFHLQIGNCIA